MNTYKNLVAELLGTFILTFIGAGSIIINATGDHGGLVAIALAHGLALAVAVSIAMNVSGGHINPAISIGMMLIGRQKPSDTLNYVLAQLVGASLGGLLLVTLFPIEAIHRSLCGTPALAPDVLPWTGVALEMIATFLLALAVYGTAAGSKAPSGLGGFGVGLTLTFCIFAIGPMTGAALNPARHFGTAIFAAQWGPMWMYWLGPVVGGALGLMLGSRVLEPDPKS